MDRISGRQKTNLQFLGRESAPIGATTKLVERFAESRQAGAGLSLGGPSS